MKLYIKNMVCDRCIMTVRGLLDKMEVSYKNVQLGDVELHENTTPDKIENFRNALKNTGFELLDDKKSKIVEKIKNEIVSLVHRGNDEDFSMKLSALLADKLKMDYHYLTTLFSSVEGITIEKYAILQRIEKVKELLTYDELSLNEISYDLGYSSVQHLSQQFKKVTGLTPSQFKQLNENQRKPLDKI